MLKCPFCQFANEDGALFCEQCKSDLAGVEPIPTAQPVEAQIDGAIPVATPVAEAVPIAADVVASGGAPQAVPVAEPMADLPKAVDEPVPTPHVVTSDAATAQETITMEAAGTVTSAETMAAAPISPTIPTQAPAAAEPSVLPSEAQPRLLVLRGQKRNVEYPLYEGLNFIGRADEKPVDIDLEDQEPPDRVWCSRQHCVITFQDGKLSIEDLNSSNGTFVNRSRIYPGKSQPLSVSDVIQIGNVQLRVIV